MNAEWRAVLTEAFVEPHRVGVEMPSDALVSLVMTFNIGIIVERLGGIESGHRSCSRGSTRSWRSDNDHRAAGAGIRADACGLSRRSGHVERDGVNLYYEVYGSVSRQCCSSRRGRSSTRGIGRCRFRTSPGIAASSPSTAAAAVARTARPADTRREFAADALAVMDATETGQVRSSPVPGRAARAAPCSRASRAHRRSGLHRSDASVRRAGRGSSALPWDEELDTEEGWAKYNRYYWLRDYRGFLEFFFSQMFTEPHSTKPIEDCVGWGLETTPETLIATQVREMLDEEAARDLCRRLRCPVLVIQGTEDGISVLAAGSLSPRKRVVS